MGKNLSKEQQMIMAILLGLGAAIFIYAKYLIGPTLDDIKAKEVQLTDLIAKIEKAEKQTRRLAAVKAEKEKLEKELVKLEKQLPTDQDIPNILRALTREAIQEDLTFDRLSPKAVESRNFFQVIPFEIQFSGNLNSFARFLSSLGQNERIFQAQNVRLAPKSTIDGGGLVNLGITLTIQTYAYTGAG